MAKPIEKSIEMVKRNGVYVAPSEESKPTRVSVRKPNVRAQGRKAPAGSILQEILEHYGLAFLDEIRRRMFYR